MVVMEGLPGPGLHLWSPSHTGASSGQFWLSEQPEREEVGLGGTVGLQTWLALRLVAVEAVGVAGVADDRVILIAV